MTADDIKEKLEAAGCCMTSAGVITVDTQKLIQHFLTAVDTIDRLEGKQSMYATAQGTRVGDLLEQLGRYCDGIEGKNEVQCGLLMCNHVMRESIFMIEILLAKLNHFDPTALKGSA